MAKRWKCARCGTQNNEPTLTCSSCRMIRGAVVVKPQAPGLGSSRMPVAFDPWADSGSSSTDAGSSWADAGLSPPAGIAPQSHWVMPADTMSAKRRFVLAFILPTLFIIGVTVFAVITASPVAPEDDGNGTTEAITPAYDLSVGQCFDLEEANDGTIEDLTVRPCNREHQYELFLTDRMNAVGYPTNDEWNVVFEDLCVPAFAEYVGASFGSSVLDIYWLVPNREAWRQGDRTIQCAVYHPNLPRLTSPLKGVGPGGWTGTDI